VFRLFMRLKVSGTKETSDSGMSLVPGTFLLVLVSRFVMRTGSVTAKRRVLDVDGMIG
jgi:hypothetical protein